METEMGNGKTLRIPDVGLFVDGRYSMASSVRENIIRILGPHREDFSIQIFQFLSEMSVISSRTVSAARHAGLNSSYKGSVFELVHQLDTVGDDDTSGAKDAYHFIYDVAGQFGYLDYSDVQEMREADMAIGMSAGKRAARLTVQAVLNSIDYDEAAQLVASAFAHKAAQYHIRDWYMSHDLIPGIKRVAGDVVRAGVNSSVCDLYVSMILVGRILELLEPHLGEVVSASSHENG